MVTGPDLLIREARPGDRDSVAALTLAAYQERAPAIRARAYDLVITYAITVNVLHDVNNDHFPTVADYYKVTALFDNGSTPRPWPPSP